MNFKYRQKTAIGFYSFFISFFVLGILAFFISLTKAQAKALLSVANAQINSPDSLKKVNTEAGFCTTCHNKNFLNNSNHKDLIQVAQVIAEINETFDWAQSCNKFSEGTELGQWGQIIRKQFMTQNYQHLIQGSTDIKSSCPQYQKMSKASKANFWVLVLNAMTNYESTCNEKATAQGPNGTLKGLMQLHLGAETEYSDECKKGDSKTAEATFSCSLAMLDQQIASDKALFSTSSYWDVLRPQAKSKKALKIKKAIGHYEPCYVNSNQLQVATGDEFQQNSSVYKALDQSKRLNASDYGL